MLPTIKGDPGEKRRGFVGRKVVSSLEEAIKGAAGLRLAQVRPALRWAQFAELQIAHAVMPFEGDGAPLCLEPPGRTDQHGVQHGARCAAAFGARMPKTSVPG